MTLIKKIEYKMGISFFKMLLARVQSKSPAFYVKMRYIAGFVVFAAGLALGLLKANVFHMAPAVDAEWMDWIKQLGSAVSAVFLFTWTGTADPKLLMPQAEAGDEQEETPNP